MTIMSTEFENIRRACGESGVPTAIPDLLDDLDDTGWEEAEAPQYGRGDNDIGLPADMLNSVRNGFNSLGERWNLLLIFNEMFHAIFDQLLEERADCPLFIMMQQEAVSRYGGGPGGDNSRALEMVEEAMSETLAIMVQELIAAHAGGRSPDFSQTAQPPGHTAADEPFAGEPEKYTRKTISDDLLAALAYFLFHGCDLPPGDDHEQMLDAAKRELQGEGIRLPPSAADEALRRAEEAARRAEEAARRAEAERQRTEDERRRAEDERRRAEDERRRAEDERRRAEDERRRAEEQRRRAEEAADRAEAAAREAARERQRAAEQRRRAEEALREARRLNERRTRMIFDLSGTAGSRGRAGITVCGVTVTTEVGPGDTAETILRRLADQLRALGLEIRGPEQLPGSDEFVIYVIRDAAGEDPTGGGFGTLDVQGLGRLSASKQRYCPVLLHNRPKVARVKIGNDKERLFASTVEVKRIDLANDGVLTSRFDIDAKTPRALLEAVQGKLPGVEASITATESGDQFLVLSNDEASNYPVSAIAAEWKRLPRATEVTIDAELIMAPAGETEKPASPKRKPKLRRPR